MAGGHLPSAVRAAATTACMTYRHQHPARFPHPVPPVAMSRRYTVPISAGRRVWRDAMEEQWYADRCRLRELLRAHPDWSKHHLAREIGRSLRWVKKWCRRLREAPPEDEQVLWGHSRARPRLPAPLGRAVIE